MLFVVEIIYFLRNSFWYVIKFWWRLDVWFWKILSNYVFGNVYYKLDFVRFVELKLDVFSRVYFMMEVGYWDWV